MLRRIVAAFVVLLALAACDPAFPARRPAPPVPNETRVFPPPDPFIDPVAAQPDGKSGPGSACPHTLYFDVPARWQLTGDFSAAGAVTMGGLTLVCELDGKPAGVLGIMRVFRGPRGDANTVDDLQTVARRFLADWAPNASRIDTQEVRIGTRTTDGLEVYFRNQGHDNREFLVISGEFLFLVDWGGFDDAAHAAGLPAYVLARQSTGI